MQLPHKSGIVCGRTKLCNWSKYGFSSRSFSDTTVGELGKTIGINKLEDWYNISTLQVRCLSGGSEMLDRYNGSLIAALKSTYPEYPWKEYMFRKLPRNYWNSMDNQRKLMEDLGHELGITKLDDWANLTVKQLKGDATAVLSKYNHSLYQLLEAVYPEHPWKPWLFQNLPRSYWDNPKNVVKFLDWFAGQNSITKMDDWYRITTSTFKKFGGSGILLRYGHTMYSLLSEIYPKFEWKAWLFIRGTVPNGFWQNVDNQRKFLLWLADQLAITTPSDWKRLTWKDMTQRRGFRILCIYDFSLLKLFSTVFPETNWTSIFGSHHMMSRQKSQQHLVRLLHQLFPEEEILVNYKHPQMKFAVSRRTMEFDAFLEDHKLAIEYQGEHHYKNTNMSELPTSVFQERDNEKKLKATELGITLVEVPFWWNKTKADLVSAILKERPDLQSVLPQLDQESVMSPQPEDIIGGIQLLLAQTYQDHMDPTDWWISEKYDGIRAYWDGKQFISRNFKPLKIPQQFVDQMPTETLDGEIWFGYNTARESMQVVKKAKMVPWDKFKFMIFDAPLKDGVFEDRMSFLKELLPANHSFLEVVPMVRCEGKQHLEEYYQDVLKKGGEGLMLRKPRSSYTSGRSANLLKMKPYRDGEGIITIASKEGESSHFECKLPSGVTFPCWVNAAMQPSVKVGSVVTFQCSGHFINGRPRKPWIKTIRDDLTVDDALIDAYHYWVEKPAIPTPVQCSCCKKPLGNIRICTKGMQQSHSNISRIIKLNLCPSTSCLSSPSEQSVTLPPFQKAIVIPSFTHGSVEDELQLFDLKGIKIVNSHQFVFT